MSASSSVPRLARPPRPALDRSTCSLFSLFCPALSSSGRRRFVSRGGRRVSRCRRSEMSRSLRPPPRATPRHVSRNWSDDFRTTGPRALFTSTGHFRRADRYRGVPFVGSRIDWVYF